MNTGLARWFRFLPAVLLIAALATAVAACGATRGGREEGGSGVIREFSTDVVEQKVPVVADPNGEFKWTQPEYRATAGDVTFVVSNPSFVNHNFKIEGPGINAESEEFGETDARNFTVKGLQPGEYTIVCTVPGHREGGMVSKLIVT